MYRVPLYEAICKTERYCIFWRKILFYISDYDLLTFKLYVNVIMYGNTTFIFGFWVILDSSRYLIGYILIMRFMAGNTNSL